MPDLTAAYGERAVLQGVNLELPARGVLALMGPGGAGKSTLLRILAGMHTSQPELVVSGELMPDPDAVELVAQRAVNYVSTVRENLVSALPNRSRLTRLEQEEILERLFTRLGVEQLSARKEEKMLALGAGERRLVAIVRAAVRQPQLVLLDEPSVGLDEAERETLIDCVRRLSMLCGVVYSTHNRRDALELGASVALLSGGTIQEVGEAKRFFLNPSSTAGLQYVDSGNCALPAPSIPPSGETSRAALIPRGFRWVIRDRLGGVPRPGLLREGAEDEAGLRLLQIDTLVGLEETKIELSPHFEYLWFPIPDMGAPVLSECIPVLQQVESRIAGGKRVVFHCKGGLAFSRDIR
ncbi:MAG: ATP-binding cassette domain-containing protein [Polyangiaceae bacterium]|nr:ATP-binding cassette domain-containing protein [Polyangiaceae bacterium]MCB9606657.1 ATP-binding cassette domain-containing protein [Polyangiaceae bacterium]